MLRISIFDALRRLPVVIGCVVLATAQPMSGSTSTPPDVERKPDMVIFPKSNEAKGAGQSLSPDSGYGNPFYVTFAVVIAAAGGWVLWRRRNGGDLIPGGGKQGRKLNIDETRPLGNRQYLLVASYEGRKFLIGVTTEKIELLTHLPDSGSEE